VGAVKVNDSLEMRFRQRMGAGGKGKKIFGDGIPAKDGCWRRRKKIFWRRNFGEGWVLAAKVKFLEMEFRQGMGAGGEGKQFFADGISAKDRCWRRR